MGRAQTPALVIPHLHDDIASVRIKFLNLQSGLSRCLLMGFLKKNPLALTLALAAGAVVLITVLSM